MLTSHPRQGANSPQGSSARRTHDGADGIDSFEACVKASTLNEQRGRKALLTADRSQAYLLKVCKRWHDRPVGTLTYAKIEDLLSKYRKRRRMMRTALTRTWANCSAGRCAHLAGEKADDVIKAVWNYATQVSADRERFVKIYQLLGKRRSAIQTMRLEHRGRLALVSDVRQQVEALPRRAPAQAGATCTVASRR